MLTGSEMHSGAESEGHGGWERLLLEKVQLILMVTSSDLCQEEREREEEIVDGREREIEGG